jgi:ornithine carbamoyltransferase
MSPLPVSLSGRDFLRVSDLVPAEVEAILDLAAELKTDPSPRLAGKTLGLFFAQPSTRTRISFSVAIAQLGGTAVTLLPGEMQLARGESLEDWRGASVPRRPSRLTLRILSWASAASSR